MDHFEPRAMEEGRAGPRSVEVLEGLPSPSPPSDGWSGFSQTSRPSLDHEKQADDDLASLTTSELLSERLKTRELMSSGPSVT